MGGVRTNLQRYRNKADIIPSGPVYVLVFNLSNSLKISTILITQFIINNINCFNDRKWVLAER